MDMDSGTEQGGHNLLCTALVPSFAANAPSWLNEHKKIVITTPLVVSSCLMPFISIEESEIFLDCFGQGVCQYLEVGRNTWVTWLPGLVVCGVVGRQQNGGVGQNRPPTPNTPLTSVGVDQPGLSVG